jgi:hypothetical protein
MPPTSSPTTSSVPAAPSTLPVPADGTTLTACADGTCEVRVDGPVSIRVPSKFKVGPVSVTSVGNGVVSLAITVLGSGFSLSCDVPDTCEASVVGSSAQSPAMGQITGRTGARATINGLVVEVVAVVDRSAVLKLTPA